MSALEIPLTPEAQKLSVQLGGTVYNLTVRWNTAEEGGWIIDIFNMDGSAKLLGVPMTTGNDMLEQYAYLGFGGKLFCGTDGDLTAPPTYENLGQTAHLYWEPDV